ncbi:MAG TPA: BamA/TamA family outer membrane protein [Gemmatimonadales bacterium]|jgi:hypothetical protein
MLTGLLLLAALQAAQPAAMIVPDEAVSVTPGKKYGGGWLHRFLLGSAWRDLWLEPIRVPVANLDTIAGGLTAFDKGGHAQTLSLRFCSTDGRTYNFRSVDKRPTQAFSGLSNNPLMGWFANEQISAMFPAAALAAQELEHAAGLLTADRWIAVLPDSPRLGKWREEFKGLLGIFEARFVEDTKREPGIPGAAEIISSDSLFPRLQASAANRFDQSAYLAARLLDFVMGDWDRHAGQWSWVRFDRGGFRWWRPLARDRDWAFSRFDGIGYDLVRYFKPNWAEFGPRYGRVRSLTRSAEPLDRRLLTGLDRAAWDSAAARLRDRLTDATITSALAALPAGFDQRVLADFGASLRSRRDALPEFALEYYRTLARDVDVRASDNAERAEVTRGPGGAVTVEVFAEQGTSIFKRRFLPDETEEIRLYLLGGADTVRVRGDTSEILVRVIPGGNHDVVADSAEDNLRVYDKPFESPVPDNLPRELFRDWGHRIGLAPWFSVRPEIGVVLGAGPVFYSYGFRRVPYQSRIALRLATTTGAGEINADLQGDFRFERPDRRVLLHAAALNADVIRYFGLGNETVRSTIAGFNNVTQRQYALEPTVLLGITGPLRFEVGGLLRWSDTDDRFTLLSVDPPYGAGSFAEAAVNGALVYDSRNEEKVPTRGVTLALTGRAFPAALDVESGFGSVELVGTTYLTTAALPSAPTLALRAGAKRMFGTYPFFEAADIGGWESFRGFTTRRFTGDAAVYGNADLRLNLGKLGIGPKRWGVLGLADIGRVYLEGESSSRWHTAFGGGLWTMFSGHLVSATAASGGERLRFYVKSGFHF